MKLVFAVDIIRHADRTSIHHIPGISVGWKGDDMGQLTAKGEKNAAKLGEKLKKYYASTHSLLSDSFQPETIFIRSSDFQRTKDTAKYIMKGMYASQFETIPVKVVPKQKDVLLLGFLYAHGKEMQDLIRPEHHNSLQLSEKVLKEIDSVLEQVNSKLGTNFNDIRDIAKIADVIKTSQEHGKSLSTHISDEEINKIFQLTESLFIDVFKSPIVACAGAGALVKQVLEGIHNKVKGKTLLKYMLFSGHDTNILSAMSLLDLPLREVPYLSTVRFELFQQNSGNFFIKASYMDEHAQIHPKEYCPFDQFESLITAKLQKNVQ